MRATCGSAEEVFVGSACASFVAFVPQMIESLQASLTEMRNDLATRRERRSAPPPVPVMPMLPVEPMVPTRAPVPAPLPAPMGRQDSVVFDESKNWRCAACTYAFNEIAKVRFACVFVIFQRHDVCAAGPCRWTHGW